MLNTIILIDFVANPSVIINTNFEKLYYKLYSIKEYILLNI